MSTTTKPGRRPVHIVSKLDIITGRLHELFQLHTKNVIQIGGLLRQAKKRLPHGEFLPWLDKEFSLSARTAERYMAAHEFWVTVVESLHKSDKLTNLKLRPSAIYELAEMHSRGAVTDADIAAVLNQAANIWIGGERLRKILKSLHPVEAAPEIEGHAQSEVAVATGEVTGDATSREATDMAPSSTVSVEMTGDHGGDKDEQSTEALPHTTPKSTLSAKEERNLAEFTASILNLKRLAARSTKEYVATDVQSADLETVADFVRAVADLKKQQSEKAISAEALAQPRVTMYAKAEAA